MSTKMNPHRRTVLEKIYFAADVFGSGMRAEVVREGVPALAKTALPRVTRPRHNDKVGRALFGAHDWLSGGSIMPTQVTLDLCADAIGEPRIVVPPVVSA